MLLTRFRVCSFVAVIMTGAAALAVPAHVSSAAPLPFLDQKSEIKLPDTLPGKCAKAFLAVVNHPSEETVAVFENQWASKKRREMRSISDRVAGLREMKQQYGSFTVIDIVTSTDDFLALQIEVETAEPMQFEFNFSPEERGKLDFVGIATGEGAGPPKRITSAERDEIIKDVLDALREGYVYPEVAEKMAAAVETKVKAGAYDDITDDAALTRRLSSDLREISKDGHLGVGIMPAEPESAGAEADDEDEKHISDAQRAMMRRENYGFRKAELLPGNIGYLRFDFFADDDEANEVAAGALAFLAHSDALIFDMRHNGGGSPEMIRYITSWLFDSPTHLNSMIDRNGEVVEEYWTLDDIPGERFADDLPVYVLTSSRTFSGAEEFSYNLKNLKRGIIVGETTGGGAHPVMGKRVNDRVVVRVPYMRANNPISKTNWEGTGVEPDVKCKADEALDAAIELAKQAIERRSGGRD